VLGRAAFFCREVVLEMGLNTKHEQVGGSADASKTQKHRQVGGRVLITQNTGHSSSNSNRKPETQNPAGAGARPPCVVHRAWGGGGGDGEARGPKSPYLVAHAGVFAGWCRAGQRTHQGRCPACLCSVLGACTG
jgi:hypothetical protein